MTRFFFDVYDGESLLDQEGHELLGVEEAQLEATRFAAEIVRDAPERLWRDGSWTVWVRDEHGLQVLAVTVLGSLSPGGRALLWKD